MSNRSNTFFAALILSAALVCGPAAGSAGERQPSAEELAVHAEKLFAKGEYDTALSVFTRLAVTFKDDPARLAAIQKKLLVCEAAVRPPRPPAMPAPEISRAAPIPPEEVMTAAGRRPHPALKAGEVLETTLKALGNFEYDQNKGGNIPDDVKRLGGARIRVRGWMIPLDQADNITQFEIVPELVGGYLHPPLIQHTIIATCPKGKVVGYSPNQIIAEGVLKVEEKKDDGYIVGLFFLDVTSVKEAPKPGGG